LDGELKKGDSGESPFLLAVVESAPVSDETDAVQRTGSDQADAQQPPLAAMLSDSLPVTVVLSLFIAARPGLQVSAV